MRDATPNWYGASPLVVGVDLHGKIYPQPLDPILNVGTWVFFFTSATGSEFPRVRDLFRGWMKRFRPLGVQFVFSFRGHYPYFSERRAVETWIKGLDFATPMVCDASGALARSFGATGEPAIAILNEGRIAFVESGPLWTENAEKELAKILRIQSPGLPLWPVIPETEALIRTTDRWPLREGAKALTAKQVTLVGNWQLDENRITTGDSKAEIHFVAPASSVGLVGRSLSDSGDPTRIRFDADGAALSDLFAGPDFLADDEGNSGMLLAGPRTYFALQGLTPTVRNLRFWFPFAKVNPVAIYGLEFGDPSESPVGRT
jgi:hypothetical protein